MNIVVRSLFGSRGSALKFDEEPIIDSLDQLASLGIVDIHSLRARGEIESFGTSLRLKLILDADLLKVCDRCLCEYDEELTIESERMLTLEETDDISDVVCLDGNLNLVDLIVDEFLMQLSSQSLCDDDCRGLCATCGKDLNEGACDCEKDTVDPRLRALLDFKD